MTRVAFANGSLQSFCNSVWRCWHIVLAAKRPVVSWRCRHLICRHSIKVNTEADTSYGDTEEEEEVLKYTCICDMKKILPFEIQSHRTALHVTIDVAVESRLVTCNSFIFHVQTAQWCTLCRQSSSPLHRCSKEQKIKCTHWKKSSLANRTDWTRLD